MDCTKKLSQSKFGKYIYEFGDGTTLHGLKYVIKPNRHYLETLLWFVAITSCLAGATRLILNSWERYNANPTVISLEKDFRDWKITFPAATVCYIQRMDESAAKDLMAERWGIESENNTDYEIYLNFLDNVANLTYENLNEFKQYSGKEELEKITGDEMIEIAKKILYPLKYNANIFNKTFSHLKFQETLTEMGICNTYAGIVANYITLKEKPVTNLTLPKCNYLNSMCYARIEDFPEKIKYYIHSPIEIPDNVDKYYIVINNMEKDTTFRFQETIAATELRRLDPRQRNCRFVDEPTGTDKVYSYNLCRMQCRKRMAVSLCGCTPHFYTKLEGHPVCGIKGLICLSQFKEHIKKLIKDDGKKVKCSCLFQCESTIFFLDRDSERQWTYPIPPNIRFRWAIERYSKTRYKRDIIFGFEDLLVSLGGTAAFFLGCSVLSFVELLYYFTLRLICYLLKSKNN